MTGPNDPAFAWELRCEWFVFARIREDQIDALKLPPGEQAAALARLASLAYIASEHSIYVDCTLDGEVADAWKNGELEFNGIKSRGRCYTCEPASSGVPCETIRWLAFHWVSHKDYDRDWMGEQSPQSWYTIDRWKLIEVGGWWNLRLRELEESEKKEEETHEDLS